MLSVAATACVASPADDETAGATEETGVSSNAFSVAWKQLSSLAYDIGAGAIGSAWVKPLRNGSRHRP
jgi:hypothetical protein